MPAKLSEIRAQYPMYDGINDEQLLIGLHRKYYSDLPFKDFSAQIVFDNKPDATEGMSTFNKAAAGFGKSIVDTGRGIGQFFGATDRADVAESRRLDADLMKTTAGKVGNFTGDVATTLPLAFVPGVNTVKGASLAGSLLGLLRPSESTNETLMNTGIGGAAGGGAILAGRGLAAGYQGVTGLLRPMTEKGQRQIASEVLQSSATDSARAAANLAAPKQFVKGSMPTAGQSSGDAGLAQLERTLLNNPETAAPLQRAYQSQQDARRKAISDVAGTPDYRASIKDGRAVFAGEDYGKAFAQGIDTDMAAAMQPQIDSIMRRPSIKSAQMIAKGLAAEKDITLNNFGSLEGLDWVKKGLDNQISAATNGTSSIGTQKLAALNQTKKDLMDLLEQIAPGYKAANDNFAKRSKQVNASDVAADLQSRLYKNAEYGSGKEMASTYQTELSKAIDSIKKQTGMNRQLSDVMPTSDISTLKGIAQDLARKENAQNLGRAVGSPTMQNMLGQNLINRISGPMGMPQSFSQGVLANTLSRPYGFVMNSAQPKIAGLLGEAMADPAMAKMLLALSREQSKLGRLANGAEKYLPAGGLLAVENGRKQ